MPGSSYLSRMARVNAESESALTPSRILFRPPPLTAGLHAEVPESIPETVIPVPSRAGDDPGVPAREGTRATEKSVPTPGPRAPIIKPPSLAPLSRPKFVETAQTAVPEERADPPERVSGPVHTPEPMRSWPATPVRAESARVAPPPAAAVDRTSPTGPRQDRKTHSIPQTAVEFHRPSSARAEPFAPLHLGTSSAPQNAAGRASPQGTPAAERAAEPSRASLVPRPPVRRETLGTAHDGSEKPGGARRESGPSVRIGALEVRIMPAPPVLAPAPAAVAKPAAAARPSAGLSRAFGSFGLTQA